MTHFDILSRHFPIDGMHFVEASAGTGKTFAIEHFFIRLLLKENSPLLVDQILVVTFTRAATRELKTRIRRALNRTQEALVQQGGNIDYLLEICEKGEKAVKEALKKIHEALVCFDAAHIYTLHGFCHRMLSEFAFESKMTLELPSPEEIHPELYYTHVVEDCLLHKLSQRAYSPHQLQRVLKKMRGDASKLVSHLVSLLSSEAEIRDYPSLEELYEDFKSRIKECPIVDPELFAQDLQRISICYRGMTQSSLYEKQLQIWTLLLTKPCSFEQFGSLLKEEYWLIDRLHPEHLKVRSTPPAKSELHYRELIYYLRDQLLPCIKNASSPGKTILRLAKQCQQQAMPLLAKQECHSPDEMLRRTEKALSSSSFLQGVRRKFRAAIIDEFQDTDPLQWNIFKQAFIGYLETVCLVGDPKQSIYAFRRADIYTYLEAGRIVGKERHKYLDTNYRSTSELVHALNTLFSSPKNEKWIGLPKLQGGIAAAPVKAGKDIASHRDEKGAIHFFLACGQQMRSSKWPTPALEEQLFAFLAAQIRDLRQKKDIPWEEIAILVKDRFQAQRVIAYLNDARVPTSFRRGENIATSPMLKSFEEFLQAVLTPSDKSALKIALAGPLIRFNLEQLAIQEDNSLFQRATLQMQLLRETLLEKGIAPFFHAFMSKPWEIDGLSIGERLMLRGDLDAFLELRKLSELLIEKELTSSLRGEDFCHLLREIARGSDRQSYEISLQEAKRSVAVMTVHLSKGLEFDTVFALGLAVRHPLKEEQAVKRENTLFAYEEEHSECKEAIEELDAEKMRTLYVALTRAKRQLFIPFVAEESGKEVRIGDASPIELFIAKMARACTDSEQLYAEVATLQKEKVETLLEPLTASCSLTYALVPDYVNNADPAYVEQEPALLIEPNIFPLNFKPLSILSFTALCPKMQREESYVAPSTTLPLGAETGILIHRLFELIFKRGLHHPLNEKKIAQLVFLELMATSLALCHKQVCALCLTQLDLLLPGGIRLKDIPTKNLLQELEFIFPFKENCKMKGIADLIFFYDDKYYLLDWKTNYLGPSEEDYTQEKMQQSMQEHHYFLQASIYTEALRRYVKLFDKRPFEEIFGGAFYLFIRGNGIFHFLPDRASLS